MRNLVVRLLLYTAIAVVPACSSEYKTFVKGHAKRTAVLLKEARETDSLYRLSNNLK